MNIEYNNFDVDFKKYIKNFINKHKLAVMNEKFELILNLSNDNKYSELIQEWFRSDKEEKEKLDIKINKALIDEFNFSESKSISFETLIESYRSYYSKFEINMFLKTNINHIYNKIRKKPKAIKLIDKLIIGEYNKNIILLGNYQTCQDDIVLSLAYTLYQLGYKFEFFNNLDFSQLIVQISNILNPYTNNTEKAKLNIYLDYLCEIDFLVIKDFKPQIIADSIKLDNILSSILERRASNNLKTIMSMSVNDINASTIPGLEGELNNILTNQQKTSISTITFSN